MARAAPSSSRSADPPSCGLEKSRPGLRPERFFHFAILAPRLPRDHAFQTASSTADHQRAPRRGTQCFALAICGGHVAAIVFGFCAAIALWAFEFGKGIAGLDSGAREDLTRLREEVSRLRDERDRAQSVVNTAGSLLTSEKSAQERLVTQTQADWKPKTGSCATISDFSRNCFRPRPQTAWSSGDCRPRCSQCSQLKWQVLVMQPVKSACDGVQQAGWRLTVDGLQNGKPWSMTAAGWCCRLLQLRQYRRLEGLIDLYRRRPW
jgi:hypothetical protein